MAKRLTTTEWVEILQDKKLIRPLALRILQAVYSFPNHAASAKEVGDVLGERVGSINLEIGARTGKPLAERYGLELERYSRGRVGYYSVPFEIKAIRTAAGLFPWTMRPELVKALEQTGLVEPGNPLIEGTSDSLSVDLTQPGPPASLSGIEGGSHEVTVTRVERNPKNRKACLNHWGYNCRVCDFDFGKEFGAVADKFIHVHHHNLISETGVVLTDPVHDMSPLCPNCHGVAHLKRPPYTIDELKSMRSNRKRN